MAKTPCGLTQLCQQWLILQLCQAVVTLALRRAAPVPRLTLATLGSHGPGQVGTDSRGVMEELERGSPEVGALHLVNERGSI